MIFTEEQLLPHVERHMRWSLDTFGLTKDTAKRAVGLCAHIDKELAEIAASPDDLEERIDVIILAMDYGWRICQQSPVSTAMFVSLMTAENVTSPPDPHAIVALMRDGDADHAHRTYYASLIVWAIESSIARGFSPADILEMLERKAIKNESRTWPKVPEDVPIEHDRSGDARVAA